MGQSSSMTAKPDYYIKPYLFSARAPALVPSREYLIKVRAANAAKPSDKTVQSNRFATSSGAAHTDERMTELQAQRTNVDRPVKGPSHHVPHAGQHESQYEAGKKY